MAACTRCHQIPEKEYDLGGGIKFTHELAYKKGVDCANCHADVIRGKGEVPRERCLVCHNRESDLARINDHAFMHAKHVAEHAINCLSCHLRIEHSFDKERLLHAAGDCAGCHPNHHQEQMKMFEGIGGKTIPGHAGSMMVTRVSCRSCHQLKEVSPTGAVLWKSSASVCSMCHEASETDRLRSYHEALRAALPEVESCAPRRAQSPRRRPSCPSRVRRRSRRSSIASSPTWSSSSVGNDIHNIHYAAKLTRVLVEQVSAVCRELKVPEPKVVLPPMKKVAVNLV